jgi:arylsulfatase A-like enzyme
MTSASAVPPVSSRRNREELAWVLLLAAATACATGLLHAGWAGWQRTVAKRIAWEGPNLVWMAPLSYLLPLIVAGLVAFAVGLLVRRRRAATSIRRIAAAAVLGVAALSLLLLVGRLYPAAKLVIALALGVRLAGPVTRVSFPGLGRAALALGSLVALLGAGTAVARRATERTALAAKPPAPAAAPNVLLLILDTVRAASLSLYGHGKPTTPALERWAAQGVTFEYAVSTAPWTLPSHGGMFTGHDAAELRSGDWRSPLDRRLPTVAEAFRDRGYRTGGFVANTYYAGYDSGLNRGFVHYEDYRTTLEQIVWSSTLAQTNLGRSLIWSRSWKDVGRAIRTFDLTVPPLRIADRKVASMVVDQFLDWQERQGEAPFFAFLNVFDAHETYDPPPKYRRLFAAKPKKPELYEACVRYLDDQVDRLFGALAKRGVLDRTVVVVTSDHGEYLGEHGRWGHGNGMHLEVLRVPLVIRYPGRLPAGVRIPNVASLRELPATLTDLAGISAPQFPGASLTRFLASGPPAQPTPARAWTTLLQDAWLPPERRRVLETVFTDDLHWIRSMSGDEFLFAYRADPGERKDLSGQPGFERTRDSLRALARNRTPAISWNPPAARAIARR